MKAKYQVCIILFVPVLLICTMQTSHAQEGPLDAALRAMEEIKKFNNRIADEDRILIDIQRFGTKLKVGSEWCGPVESSTIKNYVLEIYAEIPGYGNGACNVKIRLRNGSDAAWGKLVNDNNVLVGYYVDISGSELAVLKNRITPQYDIRYIRFEFHSGLANPNSIGEFVSAMRRTFAR